VSWSHIAVGILAGVSILAAAMRLINDFGALRRRSAFVQELARISAELVAAPPDDVRPRLDCALRRLAQHGASDAAFLWGEGGYACARIWRADAGSFEEDWARAIQTFALKALNSRSDLVCGLFARPGPSSPTAALAVTLTNEEGDKIALGFVRLARRASIAREEIDVARLALDVLGGAVRRAHFEQDRSALEARLEEARRMQALGAFASGIAHNFNNIICAIGGYAEMAATHQRTPIAVVRYMEAIGGAVGRAQRLVDQILAYGRRSPDSRAAIDVNMLLSETVDMLRAAHGPQVRIELSLDGQTPIACGDAERLQQVILNLAANAVHAMNGAGLIRIALRQEVLASPVDLTTSRLPAGRYLVIGVRDQGVGIAPSTLSRMFAPFFTTRADGNGLGLATAAETVKEFGGAIGVTSQLGQGSLFELWIAEAPAGLPAQPPPEHGVGARALSAPETFTKPAPPC
jgi:signal transduction histidine kinase